MIVYTGMFLVAYHGTNCSFVQWIKLLHTEDARASFIKLREHGIVVMPGYTSLVQKIVDGREKPCPYIRISFSLASEELIEQGIQRMRQILLASQ